MNFKVGVYLCVYLLSFVADSFKRILFGLRNFAQLLSLEIFSCLRLV